MVPKISWPVSESMSEWVGFVSYVYIERDSVKYSDSNVTNGYVAYLNGNRVLYKRNK